ncbi:cytochrome P450 [Amycolatopsis thermoflava]|uniref:cytochrome P450 n=1 Tax=Amycolatopsis thermoflava TaxID=84480 RepID=UPI003814DC7B
MTATVEFNPLLHEVQQDPYGYYKQMRDHAPVAFIEPLGAWGLFRYEDVAHTFKHPEIFSARDFITNAFGEFDPVPEVPSIIALDPPDHTRLRRLANKAFLPGAIRAMEPTVQKVIDKLLDEVEAKGGEFDFVHEYAAYIPVGVTAALLGVEDELARGDFKRWTMDLLKAPSRGVLPEEELKSIRKSVDELREYFIRQIEYRRKHPGTDLISALVKAEEENQTLTAAEVLSLVTLLQFGGSETPSHLITTTLHQLYTHPDALASVRADSGRAMAAVDETLRLISPVNFVFQTAVQDVEYETATIPAGSLVFSYISSANRDERVFEDPDVFDMDRKATVKHLSFAQGAHYCIGAPLGRMMCAKAVSSALERFPGLRPLEENPEWMPSFWVRGFSRYPVSP